VGRRGGKVPIGIAGAGRGDCAFDVGEPVLDIADRLLEIANGGFDAQQAVFHAAIKDVNGDRFA
jgi:hypothetical protein